MRLFILGFLFFVVFTLFFAWTALTIPMYLDGQIVCWAMVVVGVLGLVSIVAVGLREMRARQKTLEATFD